MKFLNIAKEHTSKAALVVGTTVMSFSASANENAVQTAINSAVKAGQENYQIVVIGIIALAALGFGLSRITGAMR